tara:strand:+ start:485 stop:1936 length:1452 start_codon:yes stop_codon:yes gene_type:complete
MAFDIKPSTADEMEKILYEFRLINVKNLTRAEMIYAAYKSIIKKSWGTQVPWIFALQYPGSRLGSDSEQDNEGLLKAKVNPNLKGNDYLGSDESLRGTLALHIASEWTGAGNFDRELSMFVKFGNGGTANDGFTEAINYGQLSQWLDLDKNSFMDICNPFTRGNLPQPKGVDPELYDAEEQTIKEKSDIEAVSLINREISRAIRSFHGYADTKAYIRDGINLTIGNETYENIVGCVPIIPNGGVEPKADVCLVQKNDLELRPVCYISYKLGTNAASFQQYGGLSRSSDVRTYDNEEVNTFWRDVVLYCNSGGGNHSRQTISVTGAEYEGGKYTFVPETYTSGWWRNITDSYVINAAVWGRDYDRSKGINSCDLLAQGTPSVNGSGREWTMRFDHIIERHQDLSQLNDYTPVYGATNRQGRNQVSGNGFATQNVRLGIYPRGFRSSWNNNPAPWWEGGSQFAFPSGEFSVEDSDQNKDGQTDSA